MKTIHYSKKKKCKICKKLITNNAIKCSSCSKKQHWKKKSYQKQFIGKKNPNYKHGKYINNFCIDCNKEINALYKRCKQCSKKGVLSVKWKGGKSKCIDCNNQLSHYGKRCNSCSKIYYRGSNHHCWLNGLSKKPYSEQFNKNLKTQIRKRDKYICQKCGIIEKKHLIKYNANLITLCFNCNTEVNGNRDYWYAYFTYIMEEIYEKI